MAIISISIIIPVYNEELSVGKTISKLFDVLERRGLDFEIIAVNDASDDGSRSELLKFDRIKVIDHEKNKGYGASLMSGIKKARFDWILITDADGTYPIESIPKLLDSLGDNDMVVGARTKDGNAIPLERKHAKKFLNWYAGYLAKQKVPDLNSGLRIFRKDIVMKYWELFPQRFSFTSTITMICLTRGYDVIFVPIDYFKRKGKSSIRPRDFLAFLRLVSKLSLFFKPFRVFMPLSLIILALAAVIPVVYFGGLTVKFYDTTFTVLCATALQTFFFGLLAEIVTHNK